jgi:predicted DNA-binding transcriptional regulator AlpA
MLTAKEVATEMKISTSWLAKRRMDGDGPPYIKVGRSIRYMRTEIMQWMRSRQRM